MISAEEARKYTSNTLEVKLAEEEDRCVKSISLAIGKGHTNCHVYGYLSPKTLSNLQELGYTVKNGFDRNESFYEITWHAEAH